MGNCVFRISGDRSDGADGGEQVEPMIKVATATGGIMELYAPITAGSITDEFPGHRLFLAGRPLFSGDQLAAGRLYHLLPLSAAGGPAGDAVVASPAPSYRMSFDQPQRAPARSAADGVWKVRLVINPQQLSEILSQDGRTEELIESVRTVAKCGSGGAAAALSGVPSGICSPASSRQSAGRSGLPFICESKVSLNDVVYY